MEKANRLLMLLAALRRRRPVTAGVLASEMGVSRRTLYRDIQALRALGASIEGSPGFGYILKPGFLLPPLTFSDDELDALVLGSRLVAEQGDRTLAEASRHALAKILDVVPERGAAAAGFCGLVAGPADRQTCADPLLASIRRAIREARYLGMTYTDAGGEQTIRRVKPIALGFFDRCHLMAAWCELRNDFRHFRTDRVRSLDLLQDRYTPPQRTLLARWRELEGVPFQA